MGAALSRILPWFVASVALFSYRTLYSFDGRQLTTVVLTLVDIACLYLVSIAINNFIVPKLLYKRRYVYLLGSFLALIVGYCYSVQFIQIAWYHSYSNLPKDTEAVLYTSMYQVFNTWLVVILGCFCISFLKVSSDQLLSQKKYEELQKEKAETELNFLKAQINPHFLFNSINSIYGSIDKKNENAREMVLKFSDMLRYQLYECNESEIAIDKEIRYLENYIALQQLRKDNSLKTSVSIHPSVQGIRIAPLIFIAFVENAFKYVSNDEGRRNEIDVSLAKDESKLLFVVRNTKEKSQTHSISGPKGIGIQNVKRRLELLYPDKHSLSIKDTDEEFTVNLKIGV